MTLREVLARAPFPWQVQVEAEARSQKPVWESRRWAPGQGQALGRHHPVSGSRMELGEDWPRRGVDGGGGEVPTPGSGVPAALCELRRGTYPPSALASPSVCTVGTDGAALPDTQGWVKFQGVNKYLNVSGT